MSGGSFDYYYGLDTDEKLIRLDTLDEMIAYIKSRDDIDDKDAICAKLNDVFEKAREKRAQMEALKIETENVFAPIIRVLHDIEWLCSNDYGANTFNESWLKEKDK